MLRRHADTDIRSLRLAELRNHDNPEEVSASFVAAHSPAARAGKAIILDWSRQRMTPETIHHLLRLSAAGRIRDRVRDLAWGRLAPGAGDRRSTEGHGGDFLSSPTVSFAHGLSDGDGGAPGQQQQRHHHANHDGPDKDDSGEGGGGSMHLALRAPANRGLTMRDPCSGGGRAKRTNALDEVHGERRRVESLARSLRRGAAPRA